MIAVLLSLIISAIAGLAVWSVREIRVLHSKLTKLSREHDTLVDMHHHLRDAFREHLRRAGVKGGHDDSIDATMRMMAMMAPPKRSQADQLADSLKILGSAGSAPMGAISLDLETGGLVPDTTMRSQLALLWASSPNVFSPEPVPEPAPEPAPDEPASIFD